MWNLTSAQVRWSGFFCLHKIPTASHQQKYTRYLLMLQLLLCPQNKIWTLWNKLEEKVNFSLSEMICFLKKFFFVFFLPLIVNRFPSIYLRIFIQRSDLKYMDFFFQWAYTKPNCVKFDDSALIDNFVSSKLLSCCDTNYISSHHLLFHHLKHCCKWKTIFLKGYSLVITSDWEEETMLKLFLKALLYISQYVSLGISCMLIDVAILM